MQSQCFIPVAFTGESWGSLNGMKTLKKKKVEMCGGVSALNCLGPTFCDKV